MKKYIVTYSFEHSIIVEAIDPNHASHIARDKLAEELWKSTSLLRRPDNWLEESIKVTI